ncbi:732_t:CDS:2 [Dentiscutata heterogama]|uniref:732_t:CDS:1 n=1 Tax=Dentiscutata heterogama TaxID=1316150 RepID=A0ACA9LEB2_9GLOM|nr:732_t:CDS:2 [Dentiscutata heterogama]
MSQSNETNSPNITNPVEVLCPTGMPIGDSQCFCDWRVQLTASLAVYLIGLIYTVPRSHITRYHHYSHEAKKIWIPRPAIVDAFGFFVLIGPIVSLNTFAIISGAYMDKNDEKMAKIWTKVHYLSWSFFCWVIMIGLVYFGSRLTNVIVTHIEDTKYSGRATPMKIQNLERGLNKLRWVLALLLSALLFFASSSLLFAIFREFILAYSPVLSLIFAALWVLIVPMMNVIIVTILAYEINDRENHKERGYRDTTFARPPVPPVRRSYREEEIVKDSKSDESGSFSFLPNSSSRSNHENQLSEIALRAVKLTSSMGDSKISEISMNLGQQSQQSNNLTDSSQRTSELTNSGDDRIGIAIPYTPSKILSDSKFSNIQ